ncbi:stage III sporulation protein AD [Lachnospiraceae bacterium LCP25S3_G4]
MTIIQIGAIGIVGILLAIQFKNGKSEYSVYIGIVVSIFIFLFIIRRLGYIVDTIESLSSYISMDSSYMTTMLKLIGITYIAEFASSICKDAGYQAIATQIEVFSKLTILVLSMPILVALLETIRMFFSS